MIHVKLLSQNDTHRLIPAKYADGSVLEDLSLPSPVVDNLTELDAVTNERKMIENSSSAGIGPGELLFGIPNAQIVNAAFCHPGSAGARFSTSTRGAWYAGFELETSIYEVAYHKRQFLIDMRVSERLTFDYVDFQADFHADFYYLSGANAKECLQPGPVPACYGPSQALALRLLNEGCNGIVYDSVRHKGGKCVVCFRPALVYRPRRSRSYHLTVDPANAAVLYKGFRPV